jgi:ribosomal protein L11 methyltransferase
VRVETGSLDFVRTRRRTFDFGLVNILAKIIIQLCDEELAEIVIPGGLLICAGLIDTQESEVRKALEVGGLSVIDRIQDKDWVGLVCRRESRY